MQCALPTEGQGWLWLAQSLALSGTKKQQEGRTQQVASGAGCSRAARGTPAGGFAFMLHVFWDKTGCRYPVQATRCHYHHLGNRNRIKSCRDPHSPGCGSSRVPAPPWAQMGMVLLYPALQLLTPRGKLGHWAQVTYSHLQALSEELIPKLNTLISSLLPVPA